MGLKDEQRAPLSVLLFHKILQWLPIEKCYHNECCYEVFLLQSQYELLQMMKACFPNPYICRRILSSLPISLDWKIPQQDKGGSYSKCFMLSFRFGRVEGKFRSAL